MPTPDDIATDSWPLVRSMTDVRNVNKLRSDYHGCENERVLFGKQICLFTSLVAWAVLVGLSGIESVDLFLVNASLWKADHP